MQKYGCSPWFLSFLTSKMYCFIHSLGYCLRHIGFMVVWSGLCHRNGFIFFYKEARSLIWQINFSEVFFFDKQGLFPQRVSTGVQAWTSPRAGWKKAVKEIMEKKRRERVSEVERKKNGKESRNG